MNTYQSAPQGQPAPGQAAAPVCPKCGERLVAGNKFCMNCGNPIE
ncbi:MAG: zinc-ribbon domain-containing protein [Lachnospiraceae bacterium]|nr:zinc-ribbon domain-containing protein [Lachnospiraceae bacterium]